MGYYDNGRACVGSACYWIDATHFTDLGGTCALYSVCEGPLTYSEN